MIRICITGGPRTGKTTLAQQDALNMAGDRIALTLRHTDDLIEQCAPLGKAAWFEASRIASAWLDDFGPWILEGVAVSRALRKWRDLNPDKAPPVDRVIYLQTAHEDLKPGQASMAKGVRKVHDEIESWLNAHGIKTEFR